MNVNTHFQSVFWPLTYDDGVNFALNLQGGVVTGEDVDHLFQLRLLNHQVVILIKVLLQPRGNRFSQQYVTYHHIQNIVSSFLEQILKEKVNISRTTLHFFPSSSSRGGLFWTAALGEFTVPGDFVLVGVACERRLGFLWDFFSSDTCFRPTDGKYEEK